MSKKTHADDFYFEGFESPNTTPVPDVVFDRLLSKLGEAELKALLYIIRRTFGFKKDRDPISFNQFLRGITTRDGRTLDEGCGIRDRTTLSKALKSLETKGIITSEKGMDERGENTTTVYKLRFKGDSRQGVVGNPYHPGRENLPPVVGETYPQQTVIQETEQQQVVVDQLIQSGVGKEKARELAEKYPPEYISEKIELLAWSRETKKAGRPIADPAAWLIRAIQQDYNLPPGFKTRAERERERARQREEAGELLAQQEQARRRSQQQQREQRARHLAALHEKYGTTQAELDLWSDILKEIAHTTTRAVYQTWFSHTQLLSLKDGVATIGVENQAAREWLAGRLQPVVRQGFANVGRKVDRLEFEVLSVRGDSALKLPL